MSTVEPRPQRADARRNRERIIDAARELFVERGDATQMDDVAERAGVGVGTVYRHFPTKQALITEILRHKFEHHLGVARRWADEPDAWKAFESFLREVWAAMDDDSAQQRLMWIADEEALASVRPLQAELIEIVGGFMERAHADGTLRQDFTVDDIPTLMCAMGSTMAARGDLVRNPSLLGEVLLAGLRG